MSGASICGPHITEPMSNWQPYHVSIWNGPFENSKHLVVPWDVQCIVPYDIRSKQTFAKLWFFSLSSPAFEPLNYLHR